MTIPKVVKDLLILPAYFNLSPDAAVIFCLSDPAKSTKWSFGVLRTCAPLTYVFMLNEIVKIEWDREDSLFIIVSPTCLFLIPVFKQSNNLTSLYTLYYTRFYIKTPLFKSCLMLSFLSFLTSSKSIICSL